ncbi:type II toxin-antitoxin system RatA family toxin [Cohaesibacter gelatinilyticus]|uniref:Coenzyme Q-binding protein COQ10 n=1 Tax=Cohaesibacter gelatinilyticus TaxID=372072 RepID=A0A285NJE9_9HYPH|nr:type II toxin-antitoxin system RatA family toxin [Cohaesibacter gelatinilyticus]SNZ07771.1 coenzyme Q-binding protein COQ10 [Cohaesibacter gelatinilyticus]
MPKFDTSHKVKHSADRMYALVADIERYPEFVPLCQALHIRGRKCVGDDEIIVADMTVAYKMIRESFTSKVTMRPSTREILVEYLDGPFKHLENRWTFTPVEEEGNACRVRFYIDYEFRNRVLAGLMGAVFDKAFNKFSVAFEQRADAVYGSA